VKGIPAAGSEIMSYELKCCVCPAHDCKVNTSF
jgi:hypothetical protein